MKRNSKIHGALLLSMAAAAMLAGCGTRHVSRDISPQGAAGEVVFPSTDKLVLKEGTFPNVGSLRTVGPGVTKDQLYYLLGRPHFREGYAGVREWDYLFHFRKDGKIITCQYKVIFDKDYLGQSFHWAPESCASVLEEAPPVQPVAPAPTAPQRFQLSADALFAFGRSGAGDILPKGRQELIDIASQLRGAGDISIAVVGHTDRIGSDAANQQLSERRAQTVRAFLAGQGLSAASISASGRGESEPVAQCEEQPRPALIACLAPNRRVDISVTAARN
jgi:outer membrane protein OmpA-like peptidoglycan-associated protein